MSESYFDAVSRRRSKLEVKISILKAISEGATRQTHIMYRSNLSWSFAHMFIRTMEKQGLISTIVVKGRKNFTLTDRGRRALEAYTVVSTELDFDSLETVQNVKLTDEENFEEQNAIPIRLQSTQKPSQYDRE